MDLRLFKTHYHKTKDAFEELAKSGGIALNVKGNKTGGSISISVPNEKALIRSIILMRRFLNAKDKLFYQTIWHGLRLQYRRLMKNEMVTQLEQLIEKSKKGEMSITADNQTLTAEQVYLLKADAHYFGVGDREAVKFILPLPTL